MARIVLRATRVTPQVRMDAREVCQTRVGPLLLSITKRGEICATERDVDGRVRVEVVSVEQSVAFAREILTATLGQTRDAQRPRSKRKGA